MAAMGSLQESMLGCFINAVKIPDGDLQGLGPPWPMPVYFTLRLLALPFQHERQPAVLRANNETKDGMIASAGLGRSRHIEATRVENHKENPGGTPTTMVKRV